MLAMLMTMLMTRVVKLCSFHDAATTMTADDNDDALLKPARSLTMNGSVVALIIGLLTTALSIVYDILRRTMH
jgi:hypothetical protein